MRFSSTVLGAALLQFGCSSAPLIRQERQSAVLISDDRLQVLRQRIDQRIEPNYQAWLALKGRCDLHLVQKPQPVAVWAIPGFYDGPEIQQKAIQPLQDDAIAAYESALCFKITGDSRYGQKAAEILTAWSSTLKSGDDSKADTRLSMSELFPMMIVAADLLEGSRSWQKEKFSLLLRHVALPLNSMQTKKNNHANWGMLLVVSAGAYLKDSALLKSGEARFQELLANRINSEGVLVSEVDRSDSKNWHGGPTRGKNGIWYTNYALMPTTLVAEILTLNGFQLSEYQKSFNGKLQKAFTKVAGWCANPETFPFYKENKGHLKGTHYISYFEILAPKWPSKNVSALLRDKRPLTADNSFPDLTFTHGDLSIDGSSGL